MAEELDTNLPIDETVDQEVVTPDVQPVEDVFRRVLETTTNPDDFVPKKYNYLQSNKKWASQYLDKKITYRSSDKNKDIPISGKEFLRKHKDIDFNLIENDSDNVPEDMANNFLNLLAPYNDDIQKGLSEFEKDGTSPTFDKLYKLNPILFKQLSTFQLTSESRPKPPKPEEQRWVGVTEGEPPRSDIEVKSADFRDYLPEKGLYAFQSLIKDLKEKRANRVFTKVTPEIPILQIISNADITEGEVIKEYGPKALEALKFWGINVKKDDVTSEDWMRLQSLPGNAEEMTWDPVTGKQIPVSQSFGYGSSPDYELQEQNQKFEEEYASGKREYIFNADKNVWEKKIPNPAAAAGEFIPQGTVSWTTVTETDPLTVFKLNTKNKLNASTSETAEVFPDQDGNQYTLDADNNQWKKLNKYGKFEYVTDQKIIRGLNYTYNKEGNYITKDNKQIIEDKNLALNSYINDVNTIGDKKERESVGYGKRFSSYLELLNNKFNKYGITIGIADKSLVGNIPVVGTITDVAGITDQTIFVNFKRGEKIINQEQFPAEDPDLYKKIKSLLLANDQHAIDLMMDNKYHIIDAKNKLSEKEKQQKELDKLSFEDQRRLNLGETLAGQTNMLNQQAFVAEQKEKEEFESQTPEGKKARELYLKDIGIRAVEAERNPDRVAYLAPNTPKLTKDISRQIDNKAEEIKIFNEKQKSFSQEINEYNSYAGVLETAKKNIKNLEDRVNRGEIDFTYYQDQRNKIISDIESRYSKFTPEYIKELEERGKLLDKEQKELNVSKSQIQALNGVIDRAVAINLEWEKDQGTFLGGLTYSALNGIATGVRIISGQSKKEQEETIKLIIGDATTKAYMEDANMLYRGIFGVVESASAMFTGATVGGLLSPGGALVGGLTSLYSLGYYEMKDQLDQIPDMSDSEKFLLSGIYGAVSSALEKIGLDAIFKAQASDYVKNLVVRNVIKNIPKGASKEFIDGVIATETKAFMAVAASGIIQSSLIEGGTESLQFLSAEGIKFLDDAYNEAKGKDFFKDKTAWEYVSETAENFALGVIGGGVMSGVSQSSKIINREIKLSENKELLEQIDAAARMENFDPLLVSKIKAAIINGKYTKEQGQKILDDWKQVKTKINSMPDNMPLDQKAVVLDLMTEKEVIGKEISGKDPLLTLFQQARIREIDEQIKTIGNAVQEPSTEGVLQRQQEGVTETGSERGGVEPIVQGQEVAQEGEKNRQKDEIERRRQGLNGVEEIIFSNPNFRLEGFEIDGNYWNVVTSTDRAKVLVNINGVIVPFYLTTGQAGKGLVPGWYPFFGIGKDGWLNKTDKSDMETYYERYWGKETADIVKSISEELNSFYGTDPTTFKNDGDPNATSRPLSTLADKVEDYINSKLSYTPAINDTNARKTLRSNVEQLAKEINAKYDAELAALEGAKKGEATAETKAEEVVPVAPTPVPGEKATIADVDIIYPTEPQAEERRGVRSTNEYVEKASESLPVEDVETLAKELEGDFGLLTAENPMAQPLTEEENQKLNEKAVEWLSERGYNPRPVTGKYGQAENSFFVPGLKRQDAIDFAKQFNQEAVAHSDGLVYQDGSMNPRVKENDNFSFKDSYTPDSDFVSIVKTPEGLKTFVVGYNFDEKVMPEQQAAPTQVAQEGEIDNIPKFQKEPTTEKEFEQQIDGIKEEMNQMPDEIANFDVPSDLTTKNKNNIKSIISRFSDKLKKAWKGGIIKNISDYSGIPMIFTISDQLGAGKVKNEFTGSTIDINGGINFNLTEGNENNAWANTTESEANKMLSRAQELYNNNKDLFDRLWREGKLPKGQVPMAVIKMGQESIQTNEALFRFASDTIKKKFNKTERTNSLNGLIKDIESVDPNSKVINFIKENNFKTIDELLDNVNKLKLGERAIITRFLFTGSVELNKQVKAGKPKSNAGLALIGNKDSSYYKYIHLNTINNSIQDESTKTIPPNHVIGLVGVDVLNPEITKPNHANYPYGVKGGLIGIIESPVHAADVFPEMYSKSFYLNKENKSGKLPSVGQVISQTVASSGAVATTKAFRGSKLSTKITELQKLLGKLKLAFPSVVIVDTQEEFQKALEDENVKKFVKDGDVIYGFTKDGKIFLNPEKANTNTAIHEFSHVWMGFLKKNNPELLKKGYSLLEGTSILKEKIKEFGNNELAREEAMAELIANRGETIIEAGKKSKFKNWLNALFNYVKSKFKSFDELSPEEFQNITLNDFVDGALKSLLKGEEITSDEIKGVGIKFQKENTRQNAIDDAKAKYDLSVTRRRNPHQQGVDAALNDLRKSDWYKSSDDTQRENAERELKKFFGEKLKSAPSVEKVLGKKPQPATFSVSDLGKALRDQLKNAAKIAREAKKAIYDSRKSLNESVKEVLRSYKGKISLAQARAILNKSNTLNLLSPEKINQFINYVERVAQNANYAEKVNKAEQTKRRIRRNLKNAQAENKMLAKNFLKIDPLMVEDIDDYNSMADSILGSIAPSRIVKGEPQLKTPVEIASLNDKINYMLSKQEESMKKSMMSSYRNLVDDGVISGDMTYAQMQDVINKIKQDELVEGYNEDDVNNLLDSMFNDKVIEISEMGVTDPNGIISRIQKANIDGMSIKDKAKLVEMLDNFLVNFAVGGLDSVLEVIEGNNQAKNIYNSGKKARPIKYFFSKNLGNLRSIALVTAPEMFNLIFNGVVAGTKVMDRAGFGKVIIGANKARNTKNALENEYAEKFGKQKNFWNIDNTIERGMVAFLSRFDKQENMQSELNRRVEMINSAIETLKKGTKEEQKLAKTYQLVADRLNINSVDRETIFNNAKTMNKDAVGWMIDKWADIYGDLSFVSLSVYNTMLSKDQYYTTDRYKKTEMASSITGADEIPTSRSSYVMNSDTIINMTETGVLMPNTRPSTSTIESQGRYIDLSFDMNNFSAMEGALVDIETAAAIRRVDAFMNSKYLSKVITDPKDLNIIKGKVSKYIDSIKNRSVVSNKQYQKVLRDIQKKIGLNFLGKIGYSLGLGSIFQPIMQTVPVILNTAIQAGPTSFIDLFRTDSKFQQWLNKSGASVSNRGQEAVTAIESADSKIKTFENYTDKISDGISKFFNLKLKYLLSKPDIWVARGAFLSYYKQYLEMNNIDSSKINWDTWDQEIKDNKLEDINKEAILYADNMVNRNQNVSDERLAGELLSSQDEVMKIIRKTLFPYASFSINSRAKIATDAATIYNWKRVSSEDRSIARKSLVGTFVEQAAFHTLNMSRLFLLGTIASLIYGDDDDETEEEREKRKKNASKFPVKSFIGDLVSPAPVLDEILVNVFDMFSDDLSVTEKEVNDAVNKENERRALNYIGNAESKFKMNPEEERKFREKYLRDNSYKLGTDYPGAKDSGKYGLFSVGYDQWKRFVDRYEMATTGEYIVTDQFGNTTKKYLGDQDKNLVKLVYFIGDLPAIIGGSFKEGSQISNKIYKKIEENSYTYEQYGVYKEFKKRYKREPQAWESMLIRENINFLPTEQSKKSITEVVDYIKDLGGFTNKEGKEFVKALGKITESYDWNQYYKMIKSGKKYEDLLNYSLKIRKEAIKKQEEEDRKLKQLEMEQQKAMENFVPPPL